MMGIGVSVSVGSVAQTMVAQSVSQSVGAIVVGISISLWLSLSRPLAIVDGMMGVSGISVSVASVGVRIGTIAIGSVEQGRISLSLRLGLWLTGDEGGKANHKSELHCCLSVESRIPM